MPGVSPSTIRATNPRDPRLRSSDASTMSTPASVAFVMNTFDPFNTYSSPSRLAVVRMPAASLPAPGSVSANAPIVRPAVMPGR